MSLRFAMVAGEASGDLLAGLLLDGLQAHWPGLRAGGIGGPEMSRRGFDAWWPSSKLAVRGYVEVLRHYREIVAIRKHLKRRLIDSLPDLFVGVDAPDFNLDLEADLRMAGVKTVHFVCPSIWAWRSERIESIRRSADHVLCIFPFEAELLARQGVSASYVGHPLAQVIPQQPDRAFARSQLGFAQADHVVALLPGSRASEVRYIAPAFFAAAELIVKARPGTRLILPAVPGLLDPIQALATQAGAQAWVQIVPGQSHQVLAACDVALVASGTATLEAALFKRPMVIAYKMHALSWQLMKRKRLQPWVGLPNILCQDFVVPELLQDAATPEALSDAVLAWLADSQRVSAVQQRFSQLHQTLQRDTPRLAADAIAQLLAG